MTSFVIDSALVGSELELSKDVKQHSLVEYCKKTTLKNNNQRIECNHEIFYKYKQ
jgi:hypothetical protein